MARTITHMTRGVFTATLGLLSLVVVLPAGANDARSARGKIATITDSAISVQTRGPKVTCKLGARSPSLTGYASGDPVVIVCGKRRHSLVLTRIRHIEAAAQSDGEVTKVSFGGAITSLSESSISLHDGNRDLTCSITDASPSTAAAKVGDHVRVICVNSVLTAIAAPVAPPTTKPVEPPRRSDPPREPEHPTAHVLTGAIGSLTAVDASSLTVHNAEHDLTCSVSDASPRLGDFHVGDRVKVLCTDGVLSAIARVE
jgi:hypothetical protein